MIERLHVVFAAAALLSVERICYVWAARKPDSWREWCARRTMSSLRDPVTFIGILFVGFKVLQAAVFAWWFVLFSEGEPWRVPAAAPLVVGAALMGIGQVLNAAVFRRLGPRAVFYGSEFGEWAPRVASFPFSAVQHPQYVGTVLTIWGLFLIARYPHVDWIVLPVIETVYYAAGARLERA